MDKYTNALSVTVFTHTCGHVWEGKPEYTKSCPACRANRTLTLDEWQARTTEFKLLSRTGAYFNTSCVSCGAIERKHKSTIGSHGCKHCARKEHSKKVTIPYTEALSKLRALTNTIKIQKSSYEGMACNAKFKCLSCTSVFETTPSQLIRRPNCPECQSRFYTHKSMRMEGYEKTAYEWLIQNKRVKHVIHNSSGKVPRIEVFEDDRHYHKPDFYDTSSHTLIECKSVWTLTMSAEALARVRANERASLESGYKYEILVFLDERTKVELPKKWRHYTYLKLRRYLKQSAPRHLVSGL
jgi:predicted  nucleic acid-binding Zn-ribbon protein